MGCPGHRLTLTCRGSKENSVRAFPRARWQPPYTPPCPTLSAELWGPVCRAQHTVGLTAPNHSSSPGGCQWGRELGEPPVSTQNPGWATTDPGKGLPAPHTSPSRCAPTEVLPAEISSERTVSTFKGCRPQLVIIRLASIRRELPV